MTRSTRNASGRGGGRGSIAFLDGSHEHDAVVAEFEAVLSKLPEPTGLVLFDNTLTDPSDAIAAVHESGYGTTETSR